MNLTEKKIPQIRKEGEKKEKYIEKVSRHVTIIMQPLHM